MNSDSLELIVDTNDTYIGSDNVFYIHPDRLELVRCVKDAQFISCMVKNSPIEALTSLKLYYILRKLKVGASFEVIVNQPVTVMQEYDAKQIVANALLVGFVDSATTSFEYVNDAGKNIKTLSVTFIKPEKNPNKVEVEILVKKPEAITSTKPKPSNNKTNTITVKKRTVVKKK